jgi:hypothetical protein
MARAQDEWVVKKIPGSGVACGVVRYGATAVLRSALVLKGALQNLFFLQTSVNYDTNKQISGVLIGVRKGERDAKVQKTTFIGS